MCVAKRVASLSIVVSGGDRCRYSGNEMSPTRTSILAFQRIAVLLLVAADCCIAQESERAPTSPYASNFSVDSGVASEPTTRAAEAEFPEAPLLYFPLGTFERNSQLSTYKKTGIRNSCSRWESHLCWHSEMRSHQYHVVDRWAPRDRDFIRTGVFLMQMAHDNR